jgi:hypothetical protein
MAEIIKATDHPLLGQLLIEAGLTRYGREPDDVPPKPMSARTIAELAFKLELAERERNQMIDTIEFCGTNWAEDLPPDEVAAILADEEDVRRRFREANDRYSDAVYGRVRYLKWKLENSKRVPKSNERIPLDMAAWRAEQRVDLLNDMWPHFASVREVIDANAEFMLAEHAHDIAKAKFQDASRERQRDAAKNIVRTSYRRKPQELHL